MGYIVVYTGFTKSCPSQSLASPVRMKAHYTLYILLVVLLAPGAFAQWSDDPTENLLISSTTTSHVQPKIVPTSDGGFYISWFGNAGFNVYLQRLDADGVPQWAEGGILIADRSFSSTEDYGLSVDAEDHALLSYRFETGGNIQAAVQRVSPDGALLWGANGLIASDDPGNVASPIITSAGHDAVVAWTSYSDGSITLQRISPSGNLLWEGGISLTTPTGFFLIADVNGNVDGSVIVAGQAQLSTFDRRFWAQKLDADGEPVWGADPIQIFDGTGGAMQFGYFPDFVLDGSGGAVFSWYYVGAPGEGFARVQHILSDGTAVFAQNGISAANDPANWQRTAPVADYDPVTGDIYVVWTENLNQGGVHTFGASAQRINSDGDLLWGSGGITLIPMSPIQTSDAQILTLPGGGAIVAGTLGSYPQPMPLIAARLTADGEAAWDGDVVTIKSETTGTQVSRPQYTLSLTHGQAVFVWSDQTGGGMSGGAILAQNISFSGVLGEYDEGEETTPPQAAVSTDEISVVVGPQGTETATLTLSNVAPAGAEALDFTAQVVVLETTFVDFEDGENPYGFTFGYTPGDAVVSTGGNPGYWFENNGLSTFIPTLYIGGAGPFTGDFVAEQVTSISVDAQTLSASLGIQERDFSLLLLNYNGGGPADAELHKYVYYVFPAAAPQPGEGWSSFTFGIPWDFEGDLPEGWAGGDYMDPENLPADWTFQDVISNVDEVNFMWAHPAWFYLLQDFHLGVDNVSISRAGGQSVVTVTPTSGSIQAQGDVELELTFTPDGLPDGTYLYSLLIETNDPEQPLIVVELTMVVDSVSGEDEGSVLTFELAPSYPNPAMGVATIGFTIPQTERVLLEMFDLTGRRVAVLVNEEFSAGRHSVEWSASHIAAGTYVYRMTAGAFTQTQRITVVK